ncbi:hypothetical protein C8J56DRAFT_1060609 [Mycena floridula]|nr:hypothetical protein C8J56DRAFT_1060609 [Mycena floridula]
MALNTIILLIDMPPRLSPAALPFLPSLRLERANTITLCLLLPPCSFAIMVFVSRTDDNLRTNLPYSFLGQDQKQQLSSLGHDPYGLSG